MIFYILAIFLHQPYMYVTETQTQTTVYRLPALKTVSKFMNCIENLPNSFLKKFLFQNIVSLPKQNL